MSENGQPPKAVRQRAQNERDQRAVLFRRDKLEEAETPEWTS